jgi:hypothetical protein
MKKATKEVNTAPMAKIRMPINSINWESNAFIPSVNSPVAEPKPKPKWLLNNKRNSVDATVNVKVATLSPV